MVRGSENTSKKRMPSKTLSNLQNLTSPNQAIRNKRHVALSVFVCVLPQSSDITLATKPDLLVSVTDFSKQLPSSQNGVQYARCPSSHSSPGFSKVLDVGSASRRTYREHLNRISIGAQSSSKMERLRKLVGG